MGTMTFWRLGALRKKIDGGQRGQRVGTWHLEGAELSQSQVDSFWWSLDSCLKSLRVEWC
jgi:hypothetical protein